MFLDHHQDTNEDPKGMSLSGIKVLAHFVLAGGTQLRCFRVEPKSRDLTGLHAASIGEKQKQRSYQNVTPLVLHW